MAKTPPLPITVPFAPASVWLRLRGPFSGVTGSQPQRRAADSAVLTLRARFDVPLLVIVERRRVAHWHEITRHTGQDFSFRVKTPGSGQDLRVLVAGDGEGVVELVSA